MKKKTNFYMVDGQQKDILDFDIVIILDACRYDVFNFLNWKHDIFDQEVHKAVAPSRDTVEFLTGLEPDNRIYITGNPYIKIINPAFKIKYTDIHPSDVSKHAIIASDVHDKPMVVHYLQPHFPFMNKSPPGTSKYNFEPYTKMFLGMQPLLYYIINKLHITPKNSLSHTWFKDGRLGIVGGYIYNAQLVMTHVKQLITQLPKKRILITADHGEMLGEHNIYSHWRGWPRFKELVEVPWIEIN